MKKSHLIYFTLVINLSIISCSKTKYSGVRQYTTNFVSYYNTYFNIKQLYKIGYRESIFNKEENTTNIISVFEYENDPQIFEQTAQFKNTTAKFTKLIAVKPYSKWIDDAILIEGKIRYLKGDLDSSIQLLSYLVDYFPKGYMAGHLPGGKLKGFDSKIIAANRKKEPIHQSKWRYKFARNEGIIWLAKAYIKKGSSDRALSLVQMAEDDMAFPVEYRKDLLKVKAMLYIDKKDFTKSTEIIQEIIQHPNTSKKEKGRMYFILGQINEVEKQYAQAKNYFELALSHKLKNDLEFESKLRMLSYSESNKEETLSMLKKMLNKGKYAANVDKIYFAMGNIYIAKPNLEKALEYYQKAISNSKNANQKFIIYERVGSIFYDKSNYVLSAKYYDSAQKIIPQNYPNKKEFAKKVEALNRLLVQYNIFSTNDSILDLAALGFEKAKEKIEKDIKKQYAEAKANELFLESQVLNTQSVPSTSMDATRSKQWYFSSKESIDKGRILFQKKWGKLLLKDNWHRSTASADFNANSNTNDKAKDNSSSNVDMSTDIVAEVEANKLPFAADAKKPLIADIQKALVNMAKIYNYEINDPQKAIETYELLFSKYPLDLANEDEHLYTLYRLYLDREKSDLAEKTKAILLSKYPESKYSLYALNPLAKSEDDKSNIEVAKLYKKAFSTYQKALYREALDQCIEIIDEYPTHNLTPRVKLLKAFIHSYTINPTEYIATLNDIISNHKSSSEAKSAKEYLDLFHNFKSTKSASNLESSNPNPSPSNESVLKSIEKIDRIIAKPNSESLPVSEAPKQDLKVPTETPSANPKPIQTESNKSKEFSESKSITNTVQTPDGLQIVNYIYNADAPHYILFLLNSTIQSNTAKNLLDVYNKTMQKNKGYKVEIIELDNLSFIAIGKSRNSTATNEFLKTMESEPLIQKIILNSDKYLISSENMDILYISSGWKQYLSFYEKNYR